MISRRQRCCFGEVIPFMAMVIVQCITVGWSTLFKAATLKGLNYHVLMFYSYGIAAIFFLPLSFFFHRISEFPPFSFGLLTRFFFLGLIGYLGQYLGYKGIEYSNTTMASAMTNLTPAATFILAVLFRMEKLEMKSLSTQVKIVGSTLTIAGALLVVLYKGPVLIRSHNSSASIHGKQPASATITAGEEQSDWIIGGALLAAEYVITALWLIYQTKAVAKYPAELVVVLFYNIACVIIAAPVCLIEVHDSSSWNIFKLDVRLYTVLYAGIMGAGVSILINTWGLRIKGPVYVALFTPLSIAIAAITGFIFLGDDFYLGSLIGCLIISFGFYALIWARAQEVNDETSQKRANLMESSTENDPLLEDDLTNEERRHFATA